MAEHDVFILGSHPDLSFVSIERGYWAGMVHSLEVRVPFVDVELFRALLPLRKSTTPPTKGLLAATPHPPLPDQILNRKETGFAIPVREWASRAVGAPMDHNLRGWARFLYQTFSKIFPLPNRIYRLCVA